MKALSISIVSAFFGTVASALVTDESPPPPDVAALAECVAKVYCGTGVYVGDRRMVTAAHVTLGLTTFGTGERLRFVVGSRRRIGTADLAVFLIEREPAVRAVPIRLATASPKVGERVWFIATGWRRGAAVKNSATGKLVGWRVVPERQTLAGQATVRFGAQACPDLTIPSTCFYTVDGAKAVSGDSGGGAFVFRGGVWELVGIMSHGYAPLTTGGEVSPIALDTPSYLVDIATYREALLAALGPRWAIR